MKKLNIQDIKASKNIKKLSMVTAYDAVFAKLFDGNIDIILVGDSLNMSFANSSDTVGATLKQMIYHTQAVCSATSSSFVVCDMPFGSVATRKKALKNAIKVYKQTKADAIKIEGGADMADTIKYLTSRNIACMGHIGLMPQVSRAQGGYKVRGKDTEDTKALIDDAKAIEKAGVFAIVLEGVKADMAADITKAVSVPIIGIGAGTDVDGQVLVWSDMFGFNDGFVPKFVRVYMDGAGLIREKLRQFTTDIQDGSFPDKSEIY